MRSGKQMYEVSLDHVSEFRQEFRRIDMPGLLDRQGCIETRDGLTDRHARLLSALSEIVLLGHDGSQASLKAVALAAGAIVSDGAY